MIKTPAALIEYVQQKTRTLINKQTPPHIILGLSGGADSVFLLRALAPLHETEELFLHAIHINHGWRASADSDQAFCAKLCQTFAIPFSAEHINNWLSSIPAIKKNSGSKEADAREVRRIIFEAYRQRLDAAAIALAHHADDHIETFFIRLIRGSGLTGLCGIKENQGFTIRPLLAIPKAAILAWLTKHNQEWCHDESNDSMDFLRNRIRSILVPALTACDHRATTSLLKTIQHLAQEEEALTTICNSILQSLQQGQDAIAIAAFFAYAPALRVRMLTSLLIQSGASFIASQGFFAEIERFLASPNGGTHKVGAEIVILKKAGCFRLKRVAVLVTPQELLTQL